MKIILSFLFLVVFSFAIELEKIDSTMEENINKAIQIIQTNTQSTEVAAQKIFGLFDSIFDYHLMAQLALSKEYKKLSYAQQKQFDEAFKQSLKRNFTDKLKLYKDETLKVLGGEKIKNNRYNLKTSIILDGKVNYIIFKFREFDQDWKIYDVDILGISIIQTYRSQFADIFAQNSFEDFLQKLKNEISIETK